MEDETIIKETQTESIKLYKNTKGVNFDCKVIRQDGETEDAFRKRLKDRFDYLLNEYGSNN